jgi:G3E family GTPase
MDKNQTRIPVTLLTGFLGSGKTTIVNRLVRQPEMAGTLVIINEFGDIGLDHMLVAHSTDEAVVEMNGGCLCCTVRGDLVKTLRDIVWRFARGGKRQFDRVLIETTGLADPVSILHVLMTHPDVTARYRLDGVATAVDMATGGRALDAHPEAAKQIAVADCLLLTKSDLVSRQEAAKLIPRLQAINPLAGHLQVTQGNVDAAVFLSLERAGQGGGPPGIQAEAYALACDGHSHDGHSRHDGHSHDGRPHAGFHPHDGRVRAYSFVADEPVDASRLDAWLEGLAASADRRILRVKGIVNIAGRPRPMVVHGVQQLFHEPIDLERWPGEDRRSRFVFIVQDLDAAAVANTFRNLVLVQPLRS